MRHLDDDTLRRLVDKPFAATSDERGHLAACVSCRTRHDAAAEDARTVERALGATAIEAGDARTAYERFLQRGGPYRAGAAQSVADFYRWRVRRAAGPLLALGATAAAAAVFAFTPAGTLAQSFLTIFEPRQFVAIPVTKSEFQYLPDLQSFGTIVQRVQPQYRDVSTPSLVAALTGLRLRVPGWVPQSVPRAVHYRAVSRGVASFIFIAAKARAYAAAARRAMPMMPSGLDGSTLTLQIGPMAVIAFGQMPAKPGQTGRHASTGGDESDERLPPLAIVESVAPRLSSTGATAREIEEYLLKMPGVAPQLADEIRAIGDPSTTMPIPVPIDKAFAQNVPIDGVIGLAVGDNTGVGGMIVWQKNGMVYGVGGALPQRDLMEVARSLR